MLAPGCGKSKQSIVVGSITIGLQTQLKVRVIHYGILATYSSEVTYSEETADDVTIHGAGHAFNLDRTVAKRPLFRPILRAALIDNNNNNLSNDMYLHSNLRNLIRKCTMAFGIRVHSSECRRMRWSDIYYLR
jgi:hypothetical protein